MANIIIRSKGKFTKEVREISIRSLCETLMIVMKNHIGREKGITKNNLFFKIFKKQLDESSASDWIRWEFVKKAMHRLRHQSNCFIGNSKTFNDMYIFFVIESDMDAQFYVKRLDDSIVNMRKMQQKAVKSVKEKWAHQNWQLSYARKRLI